MLPVTLCNSFVHSRAGRRYRLGQWGEGSRGRLRCCWRVGSLDMELEALDHHGEVRHSSRCREVAVWSRALHGLWGRHGQVPPELLPGLQGATLEEVVELDTLLVEHS